MEWLCDGMEAAGNASVDPQNRVYTIEGLSDRQSCDVQVRVRTDFKNSNFVLLPSQPMPVIYSLKHIVESFIYIYIVYVHVLQISIKEILVC